MKFVTRDQSAEPLKPGDQPFRGQNGQASTSLGIFHPPTLLIT